MKKIGVALVLAMMGALLGTVSTRAETTPDWMQYKNPYANEEDNLANPHRTSGEIASWGTAAVAGVLSFQRGAFESEVRDMKKYFLAEGWKGYVTYLQETKLLGVARSGIHTVSTASDGEPMIVSNGVSGDTYQWMIEVPIITSVSRLDPQGNEQTVSSGRGWVEIVLARVPKNDGVDGLAIQSWKKKEEVLQ